MKPNIIARVLEADIAQQDWHWPIVLDIEDDYARGYVKGYMSQFNGVLGEDSEEYREELLKALNFNIWN